MARKPRKTPMERLEEELAEVQNSISQYEQALVTLKEKEKQIDELMEAEQVKELMGLLKENHMTIEELKGMLSLEEQMKQGA